MPRRYTYMKRTSAIRFFEGLLAALQILETEPPLVLRPIALRVLKTEGPATLGPEMTAVYRRILSTAPRQLDYTSSSATAAKRSVAHPEDQKRGTARSRPAVTPLKYSRSARRYS